MPAKKNKRGDRGSTEEDTRASKKSNMAAANKSTGIEDAIEQLSDQEEPSLLEIKEILIAIKCSISSIFEEHKALRKEIEELKSNINFNDKELKDLKASLQKSKDENKELKNSLASTNRQLKAAQQNLTTQAEDYAQMLDDLDNLEQYTRKNSLEIQGLPEDANSSTEMAVIKVAEALNITVEPEDIDISHKLKNGKGIIVKFVSHKVKSKLYKERTNLKHVKISDVFPSYPAYGQQRRIFINENLTAYRRRLVEAANKQRRDGLLLSVWTLDGKVYVKTSPQGSPKRIFAEEDLNNV